MANIAWAMTAAAGAPRCAGAEAQRVCDASVGRYWKILNPASTHPATGEQLLLCWQHSRLLPSLFGCHSHHCCHPHHCCLQASRWPSSWCPHTRRCCSQRPPAASPSAACLPPSTCGSPRTATQVAALLATSEVVYMRCSNFHARSIFSLVSFLAGSLALFAPRSQCVVSWPASHLQQQ